MENSKSTEILAYNSSNTNNKLIMVVAVVALILSITAVIIAVISVVQSGSTNINISSEISSASGDSKIWQLSFEHLGVNYGYIDDVTGELKGFNIDVATAVCQIANKNCQMVFDSPQRCWDSQIGARPQGGEGLLGGYYDACVGWIHTYDRPLTFRFSDPYTDDVPPGVLMTLKDNPGNFDWQNLVGKTIGFFDGFAYDEHCLVRADQITGNVLSADQIRHYLSRDAIRQALRDGEIDAIFDGPWDSYLSTGEFEIVSDDILTCFKAGVSVMTRKDNRLIDWWNPAFAKLAATSQWQAICNDLQDEHGHKGGADPFVCV